MMEESQSPDSEEQHPISPERAIEAIQLVLKAFELMEVADSKIPPERIDSFAIIWGWCARIFRMGQLVTLAHHAGLGGESAPVVRSMMEHAMTAVWLSDTGEAGRGAVSAARAKRQRELMEQLRKDDWSPSALAEGVTPDEPTDTTQLQQLTNFAMLCGTYKGGVPYSAYRLESSRAHPTYDSAAPYVEAGASGGLFPRKSYRLETDSVPIVAAMCVLIAAMVMIRETQNATLDIAVENAFERLGQRFLLPTQKATPATQAKRGNDALEDIARRLYRVLRGVVDDNSSLALAVAEPARLSSLDLPQRKELCSNMQSVASRAEKMMLLLDESMRSHNPEGD